MKLSTLLARGYNATKVVASVTTAVAKNTAAEIKSEATRLEREKAEKILAQFNKDESAS